MTAYPFEWLEASVFYANLNEDYCDGLTISFCNQDQKIKGLKIRLLEETDFLPSIIVLIMLEVQDTLAPNIL